MIWAQLGTIITLVFGLWSLFSPSKVSRVLKMPLMSGVNVTEVRTTYGGWVLGLSFFALWSDSVEVYHCLGCGWFLAGVVRLVSTFVDLSKSARSIKLVVIEITVALLFFV